MANSSLTSARNAKNNEFYTRWADIQKEVNAYMAFNPDVFRDKVILCPCDDPEWSNFTKFFALNFHEFGLKKLVSTSFAAKYNAKKTSKYGKIFVLERNADSKNPRRREGHFCPPLEWDYLPNDGDFRSCEIIKLREEADIIITNPPFSLFREFLKWIMDAEKQFLIIGNMNAITYKEVFPLIKENRIWLGTSAAREYIKPDGTFQKMGNTCWFTNMNHGRRHQTLSLRNIADNMRFRKYDNYDAIEVPFTDAIPSDYYGAMGVPVSFLDKYCPQQFEILGASDNGAVSDVYKLPHFKKHNEPYINGKKRYKRIFIKAKVTSYRAEGADRLP